jgi:beta-1,4-mannosyl-glycoprotein beta-1,4-N-acetylglucosaminyltransferase
VSRVFDVFPFFNELDLLEVRLNELSSVVDYFVITEAATTFSGQSKPYFFEVNSDKFRKFEDRILYQKVDSVPKTLGPFERDWFQRNAAKRFLEPYITPDDYIIYGDVDEIPKAESITFAIELLHSEIKMCHLAMDLYYYYLNLKEVSGTLPSYMGEYPGIKESKWLGTTVSKWEYASQFSMTELRNPEHKNVGKRISDSGWHFSYVGGFQKELPVERIVRKIQSSAHQELNNQKILRKVNKRLAKNKDVFGRRGTRFTQIEDLKFLPSYILQNYEKYSHLVLK